MKKRLRLSGLFAAALALGSLSDLAAHAGVVVFDLESTTATYFNPPGGARPGALTSLVLSESGLTLSLARQNSERFDIVSNTGGQGGKPASFGLRSLDPFFNTGSNGFIGNLSTLVESVGVDFGDFGFDTDTLTLSAFSGLDGTGTLLGSTFVDLGNLGFPSFRNALVSASGIASFTLQGTSSAGPPNSVFFDNFTFETRDVVGSPEPSTLVAAGLGLLVGCGRLVRRRRSGVST